jgi:hypothetical protein
MAKSVSKHSRTKKASKRYNDLQTFVDLANLLPTKIRLENDGASPKEQIICLVAGHEIAESDLPTINNLCGISAADGSRGATLLDAGTAAWLLRLHPRDGSETSASTVVRNGEKFRIGASHPLQRELLNTVSRRFKRKFPKGVLKLPTGARRFDISQKIDEEPYIYGLFFTFTQCLKQLVSHGRNYVDRESPPFLLDVPDIRIKFQCTPQLQPYTFDRLLATFIEAITGQDVRHFKRCPICGKFFVPARLDKGACSAKCLPTNRIRRHRASQAKYEQTRKLKT